MSRLIDTLLVVALLSYVAAFKGDCIGMLGGTTIFIAVCAVNYIIMVVFKRNKTEIRALNIVLIVLMALNHMVYLDKAGIVESNVVWILGSVFIFFLVLLSSILLYSPVYSQMKIMGKMGVSLNTVQKLFQKYMFFTFPISVMSIVVVIMTGAPFKYCANSPLIAESGLRFEHAAIALLSFFQLLQVYMLRHLDKKYIEVMVDNNKKIKLSEVRKNLAYYFALIILFGTLLEIPRGYFFIWSGSALIYFMIIMSNLVLRNCPEEVLSVQKIQSILKNEAKLRLLIPVLEFLLFIVGGTIYFVMLIIILSW
jgi:hypothetical protein